MLLESLHQDPILVNLEQAIKEQIPTLLTVHKADGTLFIGEQGTGRNRNVEVRKGNNIITVRPAMKNPIYSGEDAYQALGAIVTYFSAPREKWSTKS